MQNLFFNSISKLFITAALCVTLLSACGGGGGGTTVPLTAEQLAYNAALATYNAAVTVADYNAAIAKFEAFIPSYPGTRVDDAKFYIARATHELALIGLTSPFTNMPTLAQARTLYGVVVVTALNKSDDAQYQIGRTYYDELDYNNALIAFDRVLQDFKAPSAGDDAQYYIGRTKHEQALLAQIAVSPTPTAATLFTAARDAYTVLLTSPTFSLSTRRDDAQYQVGRTYYDLTTPNYTQAITEFNKVFNITLFTAPSVGDDARYYLGRSKHELALLPFPVYTLDHARAEYNSVITGYPLSNRRDDARYQIGRTFFDNLIPSAANYQLAINEFQSVLTTYCVTVIASACDNAQFFNARSIHAKAVLETAPPLLNLQPARDQYAVMNTRYPLSNRVNDAEFFSALTFHDEKNYCGEQTAMIAYVNKYSVIESPITAQAHLVDIAAGTGGHGTCP